jgi:predicted transcriptional regulator
MKKFDLVYKKIINEDAEGLHSDAEVVAQDVRKLHALLDHLSQSIDSGLIQWSRENQDSNEDAVRILNLSDDLGEYARIFRKQLADERQLRS